MVIGLTRPAQTVPAIPIDRDVVQQSGVAQPGSNEQASWSVGLQRTQVCVAQLQVVDLDLGHGVEHGARCVQRGLPACRGRMRAGQQRR